MNRNAYPRLASLTRQLDLNLPVARGYQCETMEKRLSSHALVNPHEENYIAALRTARDMLAKDNIHLHRLIGAGSQVLLFEITGNDHNPIQSSVLRLEMAPESGPLQHPLILHPVYKKIVHTQRGDICATVVPRGIFMEPQSSPSDLMPLAELVDMLENQQFTYTSPKGDQHTLHRRELIKGVLKTLGAIDNTLPKTTYSALDCICDLCYLSEENECCFLPSANGNIITSHGNPVLFLSDTGFMNQTPVPGMQNAKNYIARVKFNKHPLSDTGIYQEQDVKEQLEQGRTLLTPEAGQAIQELYIHVCEELQRNGIRPNVTLTPIMHLLRPSLYSLKVKTESTETHR